jgi:hypothetical protein
MNLTTIAKVAQLKKEAIRKIQNAGFDVIDHIGAENGHITIDAGLLKIHYYPTTQSFNFFLKEVGTVKGNGLENAIDTAIKGKSHVLQTHYKTKGRY